MITINQTVIVGVSLSLKGVETVITIARTRVGMQLINPQRTSVNLLGGLEIEGLEHMSQ